MYFMIMILFTVLRKPLHSRYSSFVDFLSLKTLSFYVSLISFHQLFHSFLENLDKDSKNCLIGQTYDFQVFLYQNLYFSNSFFSKMEFENFHCPNLSFFIRYLYLKLFSTIPNYIQTSFEN